MFFKIGKLIFSVMYSFLAGQNIITDILRDGKENIFSIKYYRTGSKKLELLKLETFHPNGHVSTLKSYSRGLKNGVYKEFHMNGNIKIDGQYSNGNKSGLWTEYFREGGRMKMYFMNENGKNARVNEWYKNGEKKIRGGYFQGQKHGLWTKWHSNGVKESFITYNEGKHEGVFSYFYNNGNKKSEGTVSYKGRKEQRCWDVNGNPQNCFKGD